MRRACVYAALNSDGEIIYLGSAYDPADRWREHSTKPWRAHVAEWRVIEWWPSRAAAYARERWLIRRHRPWCNIADNPTSPLRHVRRRP